MAPATKKKFYTDFTVKKGKETTLSDAMTAMATETADGLNWLWKRTPKKGSKKHFE